MLEKVQEDRQNKIDAIRQLGIDPYGGRYETAQPIAKVLETFTPDTGDLRGEAAGRIVLMRDMGKMIFAHIRDWTGQMQICLRKDQPDKPPKGLDEKGWSLAKLLDLGDIVAVEGPMMKTRTGEITIFAEKFTLLCKSLAPMPEKYHGLQDIEIRSRKRYLDLMSNPDSMKTFIRRTEIFDVIRTILKVRGYIEVETPMMQSIYGGAAARPFLTHHNALDIDLFMRISPELFLKRLLVGGMERVFEINRNFRNEGIDSRHNPEFTMMELYEAYADYNVMMEIAEEIVSTAAQKVCGGMKLPFGDQQIDYTPPWPRYEYDQLLQQHVGVSFRDSAAVRAAAAKHGLACAGKDDAVLVNELFERFVEPKLATMDKPVFVKDYPAALCPLTRRKSDDPNIALRFECYVAGMELANAYTELNDPAIQEDNFSHQLTGEGGETMRVMDEDFVMALRHGMPPAGGMGIGIDRLVMILTNTNSIRDVILFPLLKPEKA